MASDDQGRSSGPGRGEADPGAAEYRKEILQYCAAIYQSVAALSREVQAIRINVDRALARIDSPQGVLHQPGSAAWGPTRTTPAVTDHGVEEGDARRIYQALRESRLQVFVGLVIGIIVIAIAIFLFAGAR
jgi:hypothetical protein